MLSKEQLNDMREYRNKAHEFFSKLSDKEFEDLSKEVGIELVKDESHAPEGRNYTNAQYVELLNERNKYRKALEQYADTQNYVDGHDNPYFDVTRLAKEALEE